eukprot:gnl/MRDRNA2_/MRDRNA2_94275_c0_seq1.p1 gnl/MRDRNA2_/MRDRNA2_94275_c0~~gnl/MRDRNA2_/MRDRNA2_94275_c0_seq1.p1  ORF type:complete len:436 (+),score=65.67 gnl/MRDRNA2_/MRDRNA2_94275_c0_seq1:69-1376(+)
MRGRSLVLRRDGGPSSGKVVPTNPPSNPGEGLVLIQVQAASLTATDVLLCSEGRSPVSELVTDNASSSFVPGFFFLGSVKAVGKLVTGLPVGEMVLGVCQQSDSSSNHNSDDGTEAREETTGLENGCYQDHVCVHFTSLFPMTAIAEAEFNLASVLAHVPPMVDALLCATMSLQVKEGDSLMILAPRLVDVIFLIQRLLLLGTWLGPLLLIFTKGRAPTKEEFERLPQLAPILRKVRDAAGGKAETFLDNLSCFSVVDEAAKGRGLQDILRGEVKRRTGNAGVDVIYAMDLPLAQQVQQASSPLEEIGRPTSAVETEGGPQVLRHLLSLLAERGRLVSSVPAFELNPADSEHLWLKEASFSFANPHSSLLLGTRKGILLHAMLKVMQNIVNGDLPVSSADSIVQYHMFSEFETAVKAATNPRRKEMEAQLLVLTT